MAEIEKKPKSDLILCADFFKLPEENRMTFAKQINVDLTKDELHSMAEDIRRIHPQLA